eukprot:TRINITY_DN60518_c0_g1_i1.p1 TRINITY_DN60518_c0_g1~~TRINITY_DN60518_c0_g1_i1.p1  ORF type:complete len:436 (+),score=152.02 TRINITY_DN60518_c0_g1_i1:127-1434(+)
MSSDNRDSKGEYAKARRLVIKLFDSAMNGPLSAFKKAAKRASDSGDQAEAIKDFREGENRCVLHFAANGGQMEIAKYIMEVCPEFINLGDDHKVTPLFLAIKGEKVEMTKYLLECGADLKAKRDDECLPFHIACMGSSTEIIRCLLEKDSSALNSVSTLGTPLHCAISEGKNEILNFLLESGADINLPNADGVSPLILAVLVDQVILAMKLLEMGASPSTSLPGSVNCLHVCAEIGNLEMVKLIVKMHPELVSSKTDEGATPLMLAASASQAAIVDFLSKTQGVDASQVMSEMANLKVDGEKELTEEDRAKADAFKAEGNNFFKKGEYQNAIDNYTEAIKVDGGNGTYYSNRCLCYQKLEKLQEAFNDAKAATELRPEWTKAWVRLGVASVALNDMEEACLAYFKAINLEPDNKVLARTFKDTMAKAKALHEKAQ